MVLNDGVALGIELGTLETDGPALELGIDDLDGALLLPTTDGVPLGSAL